MSDIHQDNPPPQEPSEPSLNPVPGESPPANDTASAAQRFLTSLEGDLEGLPDDEPGALPERVTIPEPRTVRDVIVHWLRDAPSVAEGGEDGSVNGYCKSARTVWRLLRGLGASIRVRY